MQIRLLAGILVATSVMVGASAVLAGGAASQGSGGKTHAAAVEGAPCKRSFVRRNVRGFARALNVGTRFAIKEALAGKRSFRVFSHGLDYGRRPGRFFSTEARGRVISHLLKRAERGDRMRLVSLKKGSSDRDFRLCNLSYVVWRRIGDRPGPGERFVGKGAVAFGGGIAVWNTGPSE